ncbi:MAG: nucleotidyltransferase domain-containing protein [Chloroflexi bacterium]|nr:nucleotidyltransferase domain-containing protein [Chloroflexota bacterium]
MVKDYPGTPQHQALLQAIVAYYANDPRIQAIVLFGSLARGNWDRYSDLDLDVLIGDDVVVNVSEELTRLCNSFASLGERAALIIPDGDDEADIVLESLMELSIRYHPLRSTSPNIVDDMLVLTGRIDETAIKAAGNANRHASEDTFDALLDRCVRYAVETKVALQRGRLWSAIDFLHRMRALVMELYSRTHDGVRPLQFFQATADAELQSHLAATVPSYDLSSITKSLERFLDFLEHDLDRLTQGQMQLRENQRQLLKQVQLNPGVGNANENR